MEARRKVELYGVWQTEHYKPPPARNVSLSLCPASSLCLSVCLSVCVFPYLCRKYRL